MPQAVLHQMYARPFVQWIYLLFFYDFGFIWKYIILKTSDYGLLATVPNTVYCLEFLESNSCLEYSFYLTNLRYPQAYMHGNLEIIGIYWRATEWYKHIDINRGTPVSFQEPLLSKPLRTTLWLLRLLLQYSLHPNIYVKMIHARFAEHCSPDWRLGTETLKTKISLLSYDNMSINRSLRSNLNLFLIENKFENPMRYREAPCIMLFGPARHSNESLV